MQPEFPRGCSQSELAGQEPASWGRHLVIEELRRGSVGVVYRAYDPTLQREVALEVLSLSEAERERVLRATQAVAAISAPNIVRVYDVVVTGDTVAIAMEYVRGSSLRAWLGRDERRSWAEVLQVFVAAGHGLAAAHAVSVVHGGFDAAAVWVGDDGVVRVTDFGVSPRVAAPTAAADQHAFCSALLEALAGNTAQRAAAARDVRVPARIERALQRGLAAEPLDRWPSMEALLRELAIEPRRHRRTWFVALPLTAIVRPGATSR